MCLCECAAAQIKETARETYEGGRKFKGGGLKRDIMCVAAKWLKKKQE